MGGSAYVQRAYFCLRHPERPSAFNDSRFIDESGARRLALAHDHSQYRYDQLLSSARGDTGGAIDLLYPMAAFLYLLSGVCRLVLRWWSDRA
jgi:hypothetical protein